MRATYRNATALVAQFYMIIVRMKYMLDLKVDDEC